MVTVNTSTVSLEEWVNMLSAEFDFSTVYSIFMPYYLRVVQRSKKEITQFERTTYVVDDAVGKETWDVYDSKYLKFVTCDDHSYNHLFNKMNGNMVRFGKSLDSKDDPKWCAIGPELLDLEVSKNGCPQIGGSNCKYCYKNNTNAVPTNMTFLDFKSIFAKLPKTVVQVPFGITGVKTNPDLGEMMRYVRNDFGAIPTVTISGKDLDTDSAKMIVETCGACAVSCYEADRELCYQTVRDLHAQNDRFHVNMHVVLGDATFGHCMKVLEDIRDGVVTGFGKGGGGSVVFLTLKPKGRASELDCSLSSKNVVQIVKFCKEHHIKFGFDSCNARNLMPILKENGFSRAEVFCEPCESSRFSAYVNVDQEYHHCSFAEGLCGGVTSMRDITDVSMFIDWWRNDSRLKSLRSPLSPKSDACQFYDLKLK